MEREDVWKKMLSVFTKHLLLKFIISLKPFTYYIKGNLVGTHDTYKNFMVYCQHEL